MLVIRLSRTGRKKRPNYRVVVAEKSAPIKGRIVELLGHYDPRTKELVINEDKAKARLSQGAQPTDTAEALLERAGILKRATITTKNRRPTRAKRNPAEEAAAPAPKADTAEAPAEETADAPAQEEAASADATDGPGETTPNPPETTEEADPSRDESKDDEASSDNA